VPIGARVLTKNPNRFEVDPQPEPDHATWAKVSITVERSDGGIVDAEIIRPRSWILRNGICAGRMLPFNLPELEVSGLALVTSIDDCPPIAGGEGSVVTARFVTREVHIVASVDVLGADGDVETITGTTIHPVWSVDRQEWVPLAELADGETLQGLDGLAVVLGVSLSRVSQPVYNIEVHGEHVYQVGELGLVVHNAYPVAPVSAAKISTELHHSLPKFLGGFVDQVLTKLSKPVHKDFHSLLRENLKNAGIPLNVGGRGGSAADWARYMTADPDAQKKAFDAVLEASRAIDVKHGTNIVQDVWRNLIGGNFTPYP
jgi:hypothetical protein